MCRTRVWWLARSSASRVETPKRGKELGGGIVGSEGAKPSLWSIIYRTKSRVLESPPLPQRLLQMGALGAHSHAVAPPSRRFPESLALRN
jgi:hypothetical protein